jgi:hypothetical protein
MDVSSLAELNSLYCFRRVSTPIRAEDTLPSRRFLGNNDGMRYSRLTPACSMFPSSKGKAGSKFEVEDRGFRHDE